MANAELGILERVDLREAWTSESSDFTPWLAREDNLRLLGETIGIELELESQEKQVGPFRADILCRSTASDDWVLIENQLERTDHSHLGQLLTYAAGLEAVTIVWIAQRFTEEHRAALDWLNEHTDAKINLFGLEVELWRIGSSPVAPKFNVVCQPNDWSKAIQQAAAAADVSPHKQLQLSFWQGFRAYMESNQSFVRCQKPAPQHWLNHPLGRSGAHLNSIVSSWNSVTNRKGAEIRAEVYLDGRDPKRDFAALHERKESIGKALGFPLVWHNPEDKSACRIIARQDADFTDPSLWPGQFEWLKSRLEELHQVFSPILRRLDGEMRAAG